MRVEPLPLTLEERILELLRTNRRTNRELVNAIYGNIGYSEFKSKKNIINKILRKLMDEDKIVVIEIEEHGAYVYRLKEWVVNGQDA